MPHLLAFHRAAAQPPCLCTCTHSNDCAPQMCCKLREWRRKPLGPLWHPREGVRPKPRLVLQCSWCWGGSWAAGAVPPDLDWLLVRTVRAQLRRDKWVNFRGALRKNKKKKHRENSVSALHVAAYPKPYTERWRLWTSSSHPWLWMIRPVRQNTATITFTDTTLEPLLQALFTPEQQWFISRYLWTMTNNKKIYIWIKSKHV